MADFQAVHMALRAHAIAVTIRSTGLVSLAATATGYTRTVGSFIDDGFERGMEVATVGLGPTSAVITSVSPTDMRVSPFTIDIVNGEQRATFVDLVPLPEDVGRMITSVIPSQRTWENEAPEGATTMMPLNGIPYLEEEFSPSTSRKVGFPIKQSATEDTGEYYLKWHGVPGAGSGAMRKGIDALKNAFNAGTVLAAGIDSLHIDSNPAPTTGGIIQTTSRPVLILTIPWIIRSRPNPS